jgi:hypothetical protein
MQGFRNVSLFMIVFKVRLRDNFVQNWHSELSEFTRALTYRSLASSFDYKLYLDNVKVETHITALARLWVSSHRLHIETWRWHMEKENVPCVTKTLLKTSLF